MTEGNRPPYEVLGWVEDVTIKNIDLFRHSLSQLIESEPSILILDLEKVNYLNSSALGMIAQTAIEARKRNKKFIICNIEETVEEIFRVVKFEKFISFFKTKAEAIDYGTR
ncbi:MAG TPA: STAS domain-containing protein [Bacillota bacterium]|nr:STAS domain-containing protein [Bacillota bacterium]